MPPRPSLPSLETLSALTATQLKALATAIGAPSSGTKSVLSSRLQSALQTPKVNGISPDNGAAPTSPNQTTSGHAKVGRAAHIIVSIDMGIRNLAYCRIWLPASWPSRSARALPVVEEWTRVAIATKAPASTALTDDANGEDSTGAKAKPKSIAKEPFDPKTYAAYAHTLIGSLLSHPSGPPTDVLIERQRFRSGGASAVQEWTLRVNMFEGMLWAVLKAIWGGSVWAMEPARVVGFWCRGKEGKDAVIGEGMGKKGKAARSKEEKMEIVEGWLKDGGVVELKGVAKATGEAYLARRGRNGKRRKIIAGEEVEKMGKLDDLADCLLQGMAWVRWEENRRKILEKGVNALEEVV